LPVAEERSQVHDATIRPECPKRRSHRSITTLQSIGVGVTMLVREYEIKDEEAHVREGDVQVIPEGIVPHHGIMCCLDVV
jgi:hypothetical protein